jgi:hypothetical protein
MPLAIGGTAAAGCDSFSSVNILLRSNLWKNAAHGVAGGVTQGTSPGATIRMSRR